MELVPVYQGPLEGFPASDELPEGAKSIRLTDDLGRMSMYPDVVYDVRDGLELHLQILLPFCQPTDTRRFPLIMFVQGSAWMKQNLFSQLPTLVRAVDRGYVVAVVQYRHSAAAPFPAQVEDAKTATRFMLAHAGEYRVDPERVVIWGNSSGGHTAALAGISGAGCLDNGVYGDVPLNYRCIVDWYGPADISAMNLYPSMGDHVAPDGAEGMLIGGKNVLENPELAEKTVIMNYLSAEKPTPPMLIMHGDRDQLVPFNQSCRLYNKMRELGKDVEMYRLEGGFHGKCGFDSQAALNIVLEYIAGHIA